MLNLLLKKKHKGPKTRKIYKKNKNKNKNKNKKKRKSTHKISYSDTTV
jgi:hypothetical protein